MGLQERGQCNIVSKVQEQESLPSFTGLFKANAEDSERKEGN